VLLEEEEEATGTPVVLDEASALPLELDAPLLVEELVWVPVLLVVE
jgi:hypothetical protein